MAPHGSTVTPGRDDAQPEFDLGSRLHPDIDMSWRRSASCGLTPESAWPGAPDSTGIRSHRLAEAARPVMDSLDDMLLGTGALILLGDRDGQIIRTVKDNAPISRMLLKRGIDDGASLAEDHAGNNGIGTALETRAGVSIRGEQHFADAFKDFVCYGHPIVDPLTRRLVGAVDLSGMDLDASRMFAPFVRKIVADIEARYVDTARADDRELWHRFVERTRNSDTATCAFGDEVVLASHSSLERLDSRDMVTLRRLIERDEVSDTVELSAGPVKVHSSRVGRRGHLLDLTFPTEGANPSRTTTRRQSAPSPDPLADTSGLLQPAATVSMAREKHSGASTSTNAPPSSFTTAAPDRNTASGATATSSRVVASQTATGAVAALSQTATGVVVTLIQAVVGPAGSGRSTTARSIAGPDATHVRLAEADDSTAAWSDLAVPALRELDVPLVLDDIDMLADADLRRLAAKLAAMGSTPGKQSDAGLVVVTCRADPRPAVTEVLDACGARTVVRPLHERGSEGVAIVEHMVSELSAERGCAPPVISARFADAACTADLPNGLVSLRSILAECIGEGVARLDVDALPSRARSARPPRSGELARGEYDAIVAALADCDGVRSRAAKRLGISRTTLYARMREFGLS